eukprot:jgi/Chlat1/454/Chrsp103S08595
MGRRAAKIATRKNAADAKRAKLYGKICKQIISVVKAGGSDPKSNAALDNLLKVAREAAVPKDLIERNIKNALDKNQDDFIECTYEARAFITLSALALLMKIAYGAGGVGIIIEVLTDNVNRSASLVKEAVRKSGGKMAEPGSVQFNFERKGVIRVPGNVDEDTLLMAATDAGAEDVQPDEDADEDKPRFKVLTLGTDFASVRDALMAAGIPLLQDNSGLEMIPLALIETDEASQEANETLVDRVLELDDVDAVYSNSA